MKTRIRILAMGLVPVAVVGIAICPAMAGGHTWGPVEVFSNADGSIQFIELQELANGPGEINVQLYFVTSLTKSFDIPDPARVPPTNLKRLLFATASFASLPGAPTPDYIIPVGSLPFFSVSGDTVRYTGNGTPGGTFTFPAIPTNGVDSRRVSAPLTGPNTPTNYAGATGFVNAGPPPGVPFGGPGTNPLRVTKLNPAGTSLQLTWDTTACSGPFAHHILFGQGLQLPALPGGAFSLGGSVCTVGSTSPYTWNAVPAPSDATRLVWFLMVAKTATAEGSWGDDGSGGERIGPGAGGSSGMCGVTSRSLTNACGH